MNNEERRDRCDGRYSDFRSGAILLFVGEMDVDVYRRADECVELMTTLRFPLVAALICKIQGNYHADLEIYCIR